MMDLHMTTVSEALAVVVVVIFWSAISMLLWYFIISLPLRVTRWADLARFDSDPRAGGQSR